MMKKVQGNVKKVLYFVAKQAASLEANSACFLMAYQPKESEEIKKLRKF